MTRPWTITAALLLAATLTAAAAEHPSPEEVVQTQLEAYNARNLEAFLATYAEDAELTDLPDRVFARGHVEMRERYAKTFSDPTLHAEILKRIVVGNTVVDHERVHRRFSEGPGTLDAIAIYAVENGKITRVWFRVGERKLAAPPDKQ